MLTTNEKARKKICPIITAHAHIEYCWGNECMMWYWDIINYNPGKEDSSLGGCGMDRRGNQPPIHIKADGDPCGNEA